MSDEREILCDDWGHVWGSVIGDPGTPGERCSCGERVWHDAPVQPDMIAEAEARGYKNALTAAIAACENVRAHWASFHAVAPSAASGCIAAIEKLRENAVNPAKISGAQQ